MRDTCITSHLLVCRVGWITGDEELLCLLELIQDIIGEIMRQILTGLYYCLEEFDDIAITCKLLSLCPTTVFLCSITLKGYCEFKTKHSKYIPAHLTYFE